MSQPSTPFKAMPLTIMSIFLTMHCANGQNLISNGDLELYSTCPTAISQLDLATDWFTAVITPDYMNCNFLSPGSLAPASVQAYSGTGFAGILTSNNTSGAAEALGQDLPQPILALEAYNFSFAARIPTSGQYTNNCGTIDIYGFANTPSIGSTYIHASTIPNAIFLGTSNAVVDTSWTVQTVQLGLSI